MIRRWRVWIALWAGWTALALFIAAGTSLTYVSTGRTANWRLTIAMQLGEWWVWAALTPLVVWLARRWPLRSFWPPPPAILVHVAAGAVLAFMKTVVDRRVRGLITGFMPYFLISTVTFQFIIYWVIVAVIHAVDGIRRERERERRAAQLETSLAEARLELLRAQLHPHFLFNTLNAIAEWCRNDGEVAERAVLQLSAILRTVMEGVAAPAWPLARELELLANLFALHLLRDPDLFTLDRQLSPAASELLVPPMILLPLAENAMKHGPANGARGLVVLAVALDRDVLRVRIENPGEFTGPRAGGTGIRSVERRLALAYDGAATLSVRGEAGRTIAEVVMPRTGPRA